MTPILRAAIKFVGFLWVSARAFTNYYFSVHRKGGTLPLRADWSARWALAYMDLLGVEVRTRGKAPAQGLLACNHLSYLDIIVLLATRRQVFLSKAEVRNWPVIGGLARCAGTLFVRRERKGDVAELQKPFAEVIDQGLPITIFPEGTSSDGSKVLPFFSSLLEPAARAGWPVAPGWIGYRMDEGSVADDVCYWRDMTFFPHFLKLLSRKRIYATVAFGEPVPAGLNRKEMALALHREVSALGDTHRERPVFEPEVGDEELAVESAP